MVVFNWFCCYVWQEEDNGNGYLVQPVGQVVVDDTEGSDVEAVIGDEDDADLEEDVDDDEEDDYGEVQEQPPSSSQKRKRDDEDDDGGDNNDDGNAEEDYSKSSKHR